MKKFIFCILVLFGAAIKAQSVSPEVIGASGDHAVTSSGSVSWTIGEPVSDTYVSSAWTATKGFHQPYAIPLSVTDDPGETGLLIYPNPAMTDVTLDFSGMAAGAYSVMLYESSGRLLQSLDLLVSNDLQKQQLSLESYDKGIYFLRISAAGKGIYRSFRLARQ